MKQVSDLALMAMHDKAKGQMIRSDQTDVDESITEELLHNRAVWEVFRRLTTYCLQRGLTLRCDFAMGKLAPEWHVRIGRLIKVEGSAGEAFSVTMEGGGSVLGDVARALATGLELIPAPVQGKTH